MVQNSETKFTDGNNKSNKDLVASKNQSRSVQQFSVPGLTFSNLG